VYVQKATGNLIRTVGIRSEIPKKAGEPASVCAVGVKKSTGYELQV
jgi:hypothetical protein